MGLSGIRRWTWTLFVFLSWIFVGQVVADPQYLVAVPKVLEAGAESKYCVSLLQPDEPLNITITLTSEEEETVLLKTTASMEFHQCYIFQAPMEDDEKILNFKVVVDGNKFKSEEVRRVMVKGYQQLTFIQTDRPLYLPGQTVHFRVVTLDSMFRPVSQLDPNNYWTGLWLNATSDRKILQLSFPLSSEAREGYYHIDVLANGRRTGRGFKVEKYVLPKFKVTIKVSDELSIGEKEFAVEVCAQYTFGQSVPGSFELELCRPLIRDAELNTTAPCHMETKQIEKNGCARFDCEMSIFTKLEPGVMQNKLEIQVNVKEEGTDFSLAQWKDTKLTYAVGKLLFIDTPKFYNQGSILEGKVKVVNFNNEPVPDMLVYLFHDGFRALPIHSLTTDSNGIATFTLNTTDYDGNIRLKADLKQDQGPFHHLQVPYYHNAHHTVSFVRPPPPGVKSFSSLEVKKGLEKLLCDTEENFSIVYTLVEETRAAVDVVYLILSRGNILMQGHQKVEVNNKSVTEGEISFALKVTSDLAPEFQIVAYTVLPNEIVIADSAEFPTEKCFNNKVSLEFSPTSAVPGEESILHVSADPGSLCGVSAVDQSVLIEMPGETLVAEEIFQLLPNKKYFARHVEDDEECLELTHKRFLRRHRRSSTEIGGFPVFKELGLKIVTNMFTKLPSCVSFKGKRFYDIHYFQHVSHGERGVLGSIGPSWRKRIRTFFPETWIWNLVEVGESGSTDLSLTVPDTITTWETEAFCLSPQGFGLAPRKTLRAFQPFFLELSLPYSIIRGEQFDLKATVFNYLSSCIMVTVNPAPSADYTLTPLSGEQYTSCMCAHERKTFSWTLSPSVIGVVNVSISAEAVASQVLCNNKIVNVPERGHIDVVTRSLIVKAEGTETTKTYNWLLCPNGESLTEEVEVELPEDVVPGSARASLSVLGDILGRVLKNPDGLLKMPNGCGEQNMALLASNIYTLEYLENTRQLTPAIKEKAANFLTSGYQRQLKYRHSGGAYSTFGTGDGNTWLTAFVLRSFAKARAFVFTEPLGMEETKTWLQSKQMENGCFKLFNTINEGGVSDDVTLSAYVTAAFLEMNMPVNHPVAQRSLSCLKESIADLSSNYTTALLAYVFTLAGDTHTRARLLNYLDTIAMKQGDSLYWSQEGAYTSTSLSVEISSYVLLAKLSASPTAEDLGYSSRIVKWLTGQQNENGGFSTTRDTVAALQALALYSTKAFSPDGSSTVTVQSFSSHLTLDVNPDNKLLYQEESLKDVTGKYNLRVKGTACASIQISLHYNVPISTQVSTLSVEAESHAECISTSSRIDLRLKSLHFGNEITSNLVVMEIKVLSGFRPDSESLREIKDSPLVNHVEHKDDLVVVHLRELFKGLVFAYYVPLIQEVPVQNLRPAVVRIYDFYRPSCKAELEYMDPCAAGKEDHSQ
ncbi:alpha-2-macroglobulin-like protein 1 isoform X1 [Xyrichtys novacula]|uniref:Alpha-2-macroglobulin-like protein 1 isoform X1 n=1 Tax=Xyrichtys novacula TaxID=13765 RepID=A0AAV1FYA8_XYRNO|nr:alpha-2-macroglobulin-like protein 1 isoform X1 [Xyrichtys novacula]